MGWIRQLKGCCEYVIYVGDMISSSLDIMRIET